ncbi:Uncharacterized protein (Fragment) [Durusdinium trenchii]|uniref:Uncharacterized protein n=1 Tax=Durusdinium trenchii TaxID=1381693 RepID=A0ABP0RPA4_9DINO
MALNPSDKKSAGLLAGVEPGDVMQKGIDIYAPDLTIEDLWGSASPPTGAALLDRVLLFYGDGTRNVPWFFEAPDGQQRRCIERSPLSRELQEATVLAYRDRIVKESISQVAAGRWAGTWNHRAEAVYRAAQEFASHENVALVLKRGLVHVKFAHWRIPSKVWQRFIVTHNSFHQGSGQNFQEYLEDALNCESEWERHVSKTGMHSSNPKYRQTYRDFALSLAHMLQNRYQIWLECKSFWNKHVDYISNETTMEPLAVINAMHSLALLLVGNLSKFYEGPIIGIFLKHALRHCVPKATNNSSGERLPGWNFKSAEHDASKMNLLNLPMSDSAVVKKLTVAPTRDAGKGSGHEGENGGQGVQAAPFASSSTSLKKRAIPPKIEEELRKLGIDPGILGKGYDCGDNDEMKTKKAKTEHDQVDESMLDDEGAAGQQGSRDVVV